MTAARLMAASAALLLAVAALPIAVAQPAASAPAPAFAAAAVASAPAPAPAEALRAGGSVPLFPGQDTLRIALTPGVWSNCDEYGGDPRNLTGGDPAIARELIRRMGIPEAAVTWVCINEDSYSRGLLEVLERGDVDMMPAYRYSIDNMQSFTNVSWGPITDMSAWTTIVRATPLDAAADSWALLSAFSPALWLALVGTALGVGLLAFLAEVATQNLHADADSGTALVWDALGRFTQARDMVAFSNAASITVLAFSFLCFILSALFTATMASRLTASQLHTGITSMAGLAGRRVAISDDMVEFALKYGVRYEDVVPYSGEVSLATSQWYKDALPALVQQLRSGAFDALVVDYEDSDDVLSEHCDLVSLPLVGMAFYAPVLRAGAPQQARSAMAAATLAMLQDGTMMAIQDKYYGPKLPACYGGSDAASVSVTFDQVASLWVLLAAGAAGSLLLVLLHLWRNRWWPTLRERPWMRTHVLRESSGSSCCASRLRAPPNVLACALGTFEAATAPYHPPADRLPVAASDSPQPCGSGVGTGSGSNSFIKSHRPCVAEPAGGGGQAAEQRRTDEERREAAHSALPTQLQTGAMGEVARNYSRLNSSQGFVIGRLLKRVRLRSYA